MKEPLRFRIDGESTGRRLDYFLATRLGQLSRLRIAALLEQGACRVNGSVARAGQSIRQGDVVELMLDTERAPLTAMTPEPLPLEIIHEDDELLVLIKPSGMLVHPTRGVKSGTLANALSYHLNIMDGRADELEDFNLQVSPSAHSTVVRPGIVHRLDRDTSGLMVVAKTQRALSILSRHFHQRLVEKRYLALVRGRVSEDERWIIAPIGRNPDQRPHWRVLLQNGKPAETRLRVVERRAQLTLVELEPITGRTNQLRIHCAHLGHPIIGDEWYSDEPLHSRLCLHAARLCFHHPSGGKWMEFTSELPTELVSILLGEPTVT